MRLITRSSAACFDEEFIRVETLYKPSSLNLCSISVKIKGLGNMVKTLITTIITLGRVLKISLTSHRIKLPTLVALSVLCVATASHAETEADTGFDFFNPMPSTRIVINAGKRELLLISDDGSVIRYPIAVPKRGKEWYGETSISGKYVDPDWTPPTSVRIDHPELPDLIPGGSPRNPMGARAITLDQYQVAIHGTTAKMRQSIGTAASYGCIRMRNEDVIDLFERVDVGTPVYMYN